MFIISQYLLNLSGTCKNVNQISTYSIITGLILYASIYLYLLFYNDEYLSIFNKFLIYIIIVDLLLSTFYYFNLQKSFKYDNRCDIEEYKSRQERQQELQQEDQESVDMSLVDNESDVSETQSEEQYEETEQELQELQEETEQELQELQELQKQKENFVQEESEHPEYPAHILQEEQHLDLDLDEIDTLLSIPVLEEVEEPKKVKAKRQPRKKKDSVVI